MIDAVGDLRPEIAERIVGQGCQVNDGVEPFEIFGVGIAHVLLDMRHVGDDAAGGKGAMLVKIAVETDNLMARLEQHRHHDSADIAQMPSDQYTHDCSSFAIPAVLSAIMIA